MLLYDSVQKTKREFVSQIPNIATLYVCGPTVYDNAHLGHAKSALVFDLLVRVLKANGYEVIYAKNITDIDDKIINKAIKSGESITNITTFYTTAYHAEMAQLGIMRPTLEPKATESLDAMFALIHTLLQNNHAYTTLEGDIYFDTQSDPKYLSLSQRVQEEEQKQNRIQASESKRNSADFALWKSIKDGTTAFDSPFGLGRPGWHIECSAMIEKHLAHLHMPNNGEKKKFAIDIHGGGADLLFPHHENEAAQTRCATDHALAAYWIHNGFVTIDGEKMSKSLGNSFFLKDALSIYDGEALRFYLLGSHYRSNFNFNTQDLENSKKRLDKIYRLKKRVFGVACESSTSPFQQELIKALNDDLNISHALAIVDTMIANANELLDSGIKQKELKATIVSDLEFIAKVLGFGVKNPFEYFQIGVSQEKKEQIETLIARRNEAKKAKDFTTADTLRTEILNLGVAIMDTPHGTLWEAL